MKKKIERPFLSMALASSLLLSLSSPTMARHDDYPIIDDAPIIDDGPIIGDAPVIDDQAPVDAPVFDEPAPVAVGRIVDVEEAEDIAEELEDAADDFHRSLRRHLDEEHLTGERARVVVLAREFEMLCDEFPDMVDEIEDEHNILSIQSDWERMSSVFYELQQSLHLVHFDTDVHEDFLEMKLLFHQLEAFFLQGDAGFSGGLDTSLGGMGPQGYQDQGSKIPSKMPTMGQQDQAQAPAKLPPVQDQSQGKAPSKMPEPTKLPAPSKMPEPTKLPAPTKLPPVQDQSQGKAPSKMPEPTKLPAPTKLPPVQDQSQGKAPSKMPEPTKLPPVQDQSQAQAPAKVPSKGDIGTGKMPLLTVKNMGQDQFQQGPSKIPAAPVAPGQDLPPVAPGQDVTPVAPVAPGQDVAPVAPGQDDLLPGQDVAPVADGQDTLAPAEPVAEPTPALPTETRRSRILRWFKRG